MGWLEGTLLALATGTTLVQLWFWGYLFGHLGAYRPNSAPDGDQEGPPVSLIICARNEAKNLRKNLPRILSQSYRWLDIIVVNDASTDNSLEILLEFKKKNPNLRIIQNGRKFTTGKKAALTLGIQAAFYEVILLTDADCTPAGPKWVSGMVGALTTSTDIVLGYSPFLQSRSFLNRFIRFETSYIATQYYSFALAGIPYMGVGRNLLYRRQLFFETGGFQQHLHLATGDDDLFINEAARSSNTSVVLSPQTFTYSIPKSNWRAYYYQKRRHLRAGTHYRPAHQLALGLLSASHLGHYLSTIVLMITFPTYTLPATFAISVRYLVVCWQYRRILRLLRDPSLLPWIPLLDALYTLHYLVFAPVLFNTGQSRQEKWKQ
jgi:poly-beta-1,6-N-acetyl-D-glucosamine synthase